MTVSIFGRFLKWYRRVGSPLVFDTTLPPDECIQRLNAATVNWDTWNPLGLKRYKSLILFDGSFKLKSRRWGADRPFEGKLEALPNGGTRVSGQIMYDSSFLGFVGFMLVAAPVVGGMVYGRFGVLGGVVIGLLLFGVAFYARLAEEASRNPNAIHTWLIKTLAGKPRIVEAKPTTRKLSG